MKVTAPSPADYPRLADIHNAATSLFAGIYSAEEKAAFADSLTESAESLADAARTREVLCVKDADDRALAYAMFRCKNAHTVWISSFYVDPAHQRAGVGRTLLETVERWAQAQGCSVVALETHRDAYWALRFYEKNGYSIVNDALSAFPFNAILDKPPVQKRPLLAKAL